MKTLLTSVFSVLFAVTLSACSDGGRTVNDPPTTSGQRPAPAPSPAPTPSLPPSAEGAYTGHGLFGSASAWNIYGGPDIETIVLDDGRAYMFFGAKDRYGVMDLNGFGTGVGTTSNGNFLSLDYIDQRNGRLYPGVLAAGYSLGGFTGNRTEDFTYSFKSDPTALGIYNYYTPADINKITGAWTINSSRVLPVVGLKATGYLNILKNGNFAGQMSGCVVSGTILPRSSGKNVFDVTLSSSTYSSPFGCPALGSVVRGIAFVQTLPTGNQLFIAVSDGTDVGTMASNGFR